MKFHLNFTVFYGSHTPPNSPNHAPSRPSFRKVWCSAKPRKKHILPVLRLGAEERISYHTTCSTKRRVRAGVGPAQRCPRAATSRGDPSPWSPPGRSIARRSSRSTGEGGGTEVLLERMVSEYLATKACRCMCGDGANQLYIVQFNYYILHRLTPSQWASFC